MFSVQVVYCQVTMDLVDDDRSSCARESSVRYDSQNEEDCDTQDRRRLLKRTRSLAVVSEDTTRWEESDHSRSPEIGETLGQLARRPQLIPRAKLIDRNSLKDRLSKSQQHLSESYERFNETCHSRSSCELYSSNPAFTAYGRTIRDADPDRLNILEWPRTTSSQYCSHQRHEDTVSVGALVDIVHEDDWPLDGDRNVDCIYTQVKRKRKEHRSLDSILFEDEDELRYFDVLNLLPLSKVRLQIDESDARSHSGTTTSIHVDVDNDTASRNDRNLGLPGRRINGETSWKEETRRGNDDSTDESDESEFDHRAAIEPVEEDIGENEVRNICSNFTDRERHVTQPTNKYPEIVGFHERRCSTRKEDTRTGVITTLLSLEGPVTTESTRDSACYRIREDYAETPLRVSRTRNQVEEAEDYKSIWISDTEETPEDVSRRPRVLDKDVDAGDKKMEKIMSSENGVTMDSVPRCVAPRDEMREKRGEGALGRIVKETSNIIERACNAVRGTLGLAEARSESSDLGLGSDCGSDTRVRSMDEVGLDVEKNESSKPVASGSTHDAHLAGTDNFNCRTNLTRSRSCVDSIDSHNAQDRPEFDRVRYKIVESRFFGKDMFRNVAKGERDVSYDSLVEYLNEYSIRELLLDDNVVIIEPVRAETAARKPSSDDTKDRPRWYRGDPRGTANNEGKPAETGDPHGDDKRENRSTSGSFKSSKQSLLKKHFFYHPIRVNRELIDEELPDPDTVRNVRKIFEKSLQEESVSGDDCRENGKSARTRDVCLQGRETRLSEGNQEKNIAEASSRSRCSSRARDLTRLFERLDKGDSKDSEGERSKGSERREVTKQETKTRMLAQSFEARSGNTSPSDGNSGKRRGKSSKGFDNEIRGEDATGHRRHGNRDRHQRQRQRQKRSWEAGSVSSGVSSDYPDTDPGSGQSCTSSEDDESLYESRDSDRVGDSGGHFVSQEVLKKIREYGTSVTYYGGKVVNSCNGPLVSPLTSDTVDKRGQGCSPLVSSVNSRTGTDYVKFRLIKSNSCDSRLELTGRLVERRVADLRESTIVESPKAEHTHRDTSDHRRPQTEEITREPPVVVALEPKRDEKRRDDPFKAEFKLGRIDNGRLIRANGIPSALARWQVNDTNWKRVDADFGKIEFEEFEVLEDSLNANDD